MKKVITIAIVTILTSTAAFANENKEVATKEESAKVVRTKETMKLIKKEYKKSAKMFREKALFC